MSAANTPPGAVAPSGTTATDNSNEIPLAAHNAPEGYKVMKEGMASILIKGNDVFYNEAQVINRDLSTAVLRHFLPMLGKEREEALAETRARGGFAKGAWRARQRVEKEVVAERGLDGDVPGKSVPTSDVKDGETLSLIHI